jgi:hypothetical protein
MKTLLLLLPTFVSSFSVVVPTTRAFLRQDVLLAAEENSEQEGTGLVLNGLDKEMSEFGGEYSFSETDYLAAARKRAAERKESANGDASDDEWKKIAQDKATKYGTVDDWENSRKEAGNADSQVLMFTEPPTDGDDENGEGSDGKLLLF